MTTASTEIHTCYTKDGSRIDYETPKGFRISNPAHVEFLIEDHLILENYPDLAELADLAHCGGPFYLEHFAPVIDLLYCRVVVLPGIYRICGDCEREMETMAQGKRPDMRPTRVEPPVRKGEGRLPSELLSQGWAQGYFARDAEGFPVEEEEDAACAWCLSGAVRVSRAAGLVSESEKLAYRRELARLLQEDGWPDISLVAWNDMPEQEQSEVVDLCRRAEYNLCLAV